VAQGEKVAIIGPSGSGKTTVLRMLMTLERIDEGIIFVDGDASLSPIECKLWRVAEAMIASSGASIRLTSAFSNHLSCCW
jgi:ABC-type polar amino acid transport system ATPase subunit